MTYKKDFDPLVRCFGRLCVCTCMHGRLCVCTCMHGRLCVSTCVHKHTHTHGAPSKCYLHNSSRRCQWCIRPPKYTQPYKDTCMYACMHVQGFEYHAVEYQSANIRTGTDLHSNTYMHTYTRICMRRAWNTMLWSINQPARSRGHRRLAEAHLTRWGHLTTRMYRRHPPRCPPEAPPPYTAQTSPISTRPSLRRAITTSTRKAHRRRLYSARALPPSTTPRGKK